MANVNWERGPITQVVLNRPHVRNALNSETIEELLAVLVDIAHDPGVEVVILTGAGEKAFCSGADLAEVGSLRSSEQVRTYFGKMAQLIQSLQQLPQPVIGAVFGHVLAGGMGLAAGVDLLVADENTQFGLPEVKVGLYPMVVTAPISRLIGMRRTLELSLTGRLIDANTAERWGLVNRIAAEGQALHEAWQLANEIRVGSPVIARLGKEGWRRAQDLEMADALTALRDLVTLVALSEDSREGVAAFIEKRPPQWPSKQ
ncbi:MAG: enoyl-CoA hydratase/isomerase family protein [Sulfobacillus acidophilus]|uniref:Enoyl-CoA hydratase/isomerase family protein n=1 Tax=Sulfobacillus acidophilus TaxID=53633 RepID=A0A2T2WL26_9FIRM|nr:MAG: enoyl-CoA hydratase/isomerase family protein [Sulfobacillus acidophilus]